MQEPKFVNTDIDTIIAEIISDYETRTGLTLQPAQGETLLLKTIAYREQLLRIGINEAGKKSLVAFASGISLDELGGLVGVNRLGALRATCMLRFAMVEGHEGATIPFRTSVTSVDGLVIFRTLESKVVVEGVASIDIEAECLTEGIVGNGYLAGSINTLNDPIAYVQSVTNVDTTGGGSDEETDENMRERIYDAPSAFSTAGSTAAYKYWTKTASSEIIDVEVLASTPGVVTVYPLVDGGVASAGLLDLIDERLNTDNIKPVCDTIDVQNPDVENYEIEVDVKLYSDADEVAVIASINAALDLYASGVKKRLGVDVIRMQITKACMLDGVYDVVVNSPAANIVLTREQVAICTGISVTLTGTENG